MVQLDVSRECVAVDSEWDKVGVDCLVSVPEAVLPPGLLNAHGGSYVTGSCTRSVTVVATPRTVVRYTRVMVFV